MNLGKQPSGHRSSIAHRRLATIVLTATVIVTAGPAVRPATAEELTPTAALALRLADQVPAAERKSLVASYRRTRSQLPGQGKVNLIARAAVAPPVCRDAFPPGVARNICAEMIGKVKRGGKTTGKCVAGIIAVIVRPMGKTIAFLTKSCGPPAAALAVGAGFAFLNSKCKAITPRFLEWSCNLLF